MKFIKSGTRADTCRDSKMSVPAAVSQIIVMTAPVTGSAERGGRCCLKEALLRSMISETQVKKKPSGWRAFPIFPEKPRHGHSQDAGMVMIPLLLRYFYRGNIVFFFSIEFSYAQCIEQFTGQERLC